MSENQSNLRDKAQSPHSTQTEGGDDFPIGVVLLPIFAISGLIFGFVSGRVLEVWIDYDLGIAFEAVFGERHIAGSSLLFFLGGGFVGLVVSIYLLVKIGNTKPMKSIEAGWDSCKIGTRKVFAVIICVFYLGFLYLLYPTSGEEEMFLTIFPKGTKEDFVQFLENYPNGRFNAAARKIISSKENKNYYSSNESIGLETLGEVEIDSNYFSISQGFLRSDGSPLLGKMPEKIATRDKKKKGKRDNRFGLIQKTVTSIKKRIVIGHDGFEGKRLQSIIYIDNASISEYFYEVNLFVGTNKFSSKIPPKSQVRIRFNKDLAAEIVQLKVSQSSNFEEFEEIVFPLSSKFFVTDVYNVNGENSYSVESEIYTFQ